MNGYLWTELECKEPVNPEQLADYIYSRFQEACGGSSAGVAAAAAAAAPTPAAPQTPTPPSTSPPSTGRSPPLRCSTTTTTPSKQRASDAPPATTPPGSERAADSSMNHAGSSTPSAPAVDRTLTGTGSSVGAPLNSLTAALASFVAGVVAVEQVPLSNASERSSRERFLRGAAVQGLPSAAAQLVSAVKEFNEVLALLLADDAFLPSRQPQRSSRVECQQLVHSCNAKLKAAKVRVEAALNTLTGAEESDGEAGGSDAGADESEAEEAAKESLYGECEELYQSILLPRYTIGQTVLAARVALTLRTAEVVDYANKEYEQLMQGEGNDEAAARAHAELPARTSELMAAVPVLHAAFVAAMTMKDRKLKGKDVQLELQRYTLQLDGLGLHDAEKWMSEYIVPRFAPGSVTTTPTAALAAFGTSASHTFNSNTTTPKSGLTRKHSSSALSHTNSTVHLSRSVSTAVVGGPRPPEDPDDVLGLLEYAEAVADEQAPLYDALGRINLWLRRAGLAHEVAVDAVRGKALPATADRGDGNPYIPHRLAEGLWTKTHSEQYEHLCLRHRLLVEKSEVEKEFDEMLTLPDDQFVRTCHEDLLQSLFARSDDACFDGKARQQVEKRLRSCLQMRIKVYGHDGDIRAVTLPQTASLTDVFDALAEWMPDLRECRITYRDDGDSVSLATEREFRELVRQLRAASIAEGGGGGGLGQTLNGGTLSRTTIGTSTAGGDVRVELYVDLPQTKGRTAVAKHSSSSSSYPTDRKPDGRRPLDQRQQHKPITSSDGKVPTVASSSTVRRGEERDIGASSSSGAGGGGPLSRSLLGRYAMSASAKQQPTRSSGGGGSGGDTSVAPPLASAAAAAYHSMQPMALPDLRYELKVLERHGQQASFSSSPPPPPAVASGSGAVYEPPSQPTSSVVPGAGTLPIEPVLPEDLIRQLRQQQQLYNQPSVPATAVATAAPPPPPPPPRNVEAYPRQEAPYHHQPPPPLQPGQPASTSTTGQPPCGGARAAAPVHTKQDVRVSEWDRPRGMGSLSFAQHTVVGDEGDDERIERRMRGEPIASPTANRRNGGGGGGGVSRISALRQNRAQPSHATRAQR